MTRYSPQRQAQRDHADRLLAIMKHAGYSKRNLRKTTTKAVHEIDQRIYRLENMSHSEFMQSISRNIFGVAQKEYYIGRLKKQRDAYQSAASSVEYLLESRDKPQFPWMLKHSYAGRIREMRVALAKFKTRQPTLDKYKRRK